MHFEWDSRKNATNHRKHGIFFEEAVTVFLDPSARIFDDPDHSSDEVREIIVGHSVRLRILIVCFTEREEKVRIISARVATKRERISHEQKTSTS
jgi:uncharacterized protein